MILAIIIGTKLLVSDKFAFYKKTRKKKKINNTYYTLKK